MTIGDKVHVQIYGASELVTILAIHAFGTFDIERSDGRCFRVSGFSDHKTVFPIGNNCCYRDPR